MSGTIILAAAVLSCMVLAVIVLVAYGRGYVDGTRAGALDQVRAEERRVVEQIKRAEERLS